MDPKRIFNAADAIALELGGIEHVTINAVRARTGGRKDAVSGFLAEWRNERRKFKSTIPDTLLKTGRVWMEEMWVLGYIAAGHPAAGRPARTSDGGLESDNRTKSEASRNPKMAATVPGRPYLTVPGHRSVHHEGFLKSRGLLEGARHSRAGGHEDRAASTFEVTRPDEARAPNARCVQRAKPRKPAAVDVAAAPLQPRDFKKATRLANMKGREREIFMADIADEMERVLKDAKYPLTSSEVFRRIDKKMKIFPASKARATFTEAARGRLPIILKDQWLLPGTTMEWQPKNKSQISPTALAQSRRHMKAAINRAIDLLEKEGTPMTAENLYQKSAAEDFGLRWFKWALNDRCRRGRIVREDDGKYKVQVNAQS